MKKCQGTHKKDEKSIGWLSAQVGSETVILYNFWIEFLYNFQPKADPYSARFACLIKKSATPRNWSKISYKIIQNSAFGCREENQIKKAEKEKYKSWKSAKALTKRMKKPLTKKRSQIFFTLFPFCHLFISSFIFHFSSFYVISSRRLILIQHALRAW